MTGDTQGAVTCLLKAVELAPDDGQAIFNLGVITEAMGDLNAARQHYLRAQQQLSDFPTDILRNCEAKIRLQEERESKTD